MDDNKNKTTNDSEAAKALDDNVVVQPITDEEPLVAEAVEQETVVNESVKPEADEQKTAKQKAAKEEAAEQEKADEESDKHLKEAIAEQAREDERPHSTNFTLGKILGGDILTAQMFRSNIWLIVLIVGFAIIYITNRYKVQKDLLEIDKLNTELEDAKYRALSSSSNLTEKSRESHVLESLSNGPDSTLKQSDQPPYIIEVPDK